MKLREVAIETDTRGRPVVGTVVEDCYAIMDSAARVVCYVPVSAGHRVATEIVRVLAAFAQPGG